jgi:HK97 family phage prohead protease
MPPTLAQAQAEAAFLSLYPPRPRRKVQPRRVEPQKPRYLYHRGVSIGGLVTPTGVKSPELNLGLHAFFEPDSFKKALKKIRKRKLNVILGIDHQGCFGSTTEGNLRLWQDRFGLCFLFTPRLDAAGTQILEDFKAGKFNGVSLGYRKKKAWFGQRHPPTVHIGKADIREVTLCRAPFQPAFPQAKRFLALYMPDPKRPGKFLRWDPHTQRARPTDEFRGEFTRQNDRAILYMYQEGLLPF